MAHKEIQENNFTATEKDIQQIADNYLALFLLFIPMPVWGDTVPIEGRWGETGLRSFSPVPFTVEKENNVLYIVAN
jgi:hypothetical protein